MAEVATLKQSDPKIFTEWSYKNVPIPDHLKERVPANAIYIEGYANTSSKDDYDDVIFASQWTDAILSQYLANPVLLYEHDPEQPVGRVLEAYAKDQGLWISGFVSKSWNGAWKVEEKIVNGLSVRIKYDWDNTYYDQTSETWIVGVKRLREISVCSMPANDDSLFDVMKSSAKGYKSKNTMSLLKSIGALLGLPNADAATEEQVLKAVGDLKNSNSGLTSEDVQKLISDALAAQSKPEETTPKAEEKSADFVTQADFKKTTDVILSKLNEIAGATAESNVKSGEGKAASAGAEVKTETKTSTEGRVKGVLTAEVKIESDHKK